MTNISLDITPFRVLGTVSGGRGLYTQPILYVITDSSLYENVMLVRPLGRIFRPYNLAISIRIELMEAALLDINEPSVGHWELPELYQDPFQINGLGYSITSIHQSFADSYIPSVDVDITRRPDKDVRRETT